ncbi:MAG: hypothetical protein V2I74_13460 [Erythrobacter sp.]|jgi:hypothetical protein|nr:hypothetical protein [Erythrobacter sp.]
MPALLLLSLVAAQANPAPPQAGEQAVCDLHVWGARKSFPADARFAAPFAIKGTFHADRAQPLANINVLDPVLRLSRVDDASFAGYFGEGTAVNVIRHDETLDPKQAQRAAAPLSGQSAVCQGDLILSDLVDIEYPANRQSQGILTDLLMAPAGMNMQVTFRRFDASGKAIFVKRDGVSGPLAVTRSEWGKDAEAAVKAIDGSVAAGLQLFVEEHLVKKKAKS